jgi:hypothetical protein
MAIARVNYLDEGRERFIRGDLLEENQEFIKILLNEYVLTISKKIILKLEVSRR